MVSGMRRIFSIFAFLVFLPKLSFPASEQPANGFFILRFDKSVERKIDFVVKRASLVSQDNLNKSFQLMVFVPIETPEISDLLLVIDELHIRAHSRGSSEGESRDYAFIIPGNSVEKVAKFFKISPRTRTHPGHQMTSVFEPLKNEYKMGEEVKLKLVITNLGKSPMGFQVGGRNRGARDNQFFFSLFRNNRPVPDIGDPTNFGGMSTRAIVKPGEKFEKEIELSKWFKFEEGFYDGLGSFYLGMNPVSNKDEFDVIWEDYATAPFSFRVVKNP